MLTSIDHLNTKVVVRRVGMGTAPFTWEIQGSSSTASQYVSSDRFRTMEAAYAAGQARLPEFLLQKTVKQKKTQALRMPIIADNHDWQSDEDDLDETDLDTDAEVCEVLVVSHDGQASGRPLSANPEQIAA